MTNKIFSVMAEIANELDVYERGELLEIMREAIEGSTDFTVQTERGEYRFICGDHIDEILKDELSSDDYILGCFASWIIADALDMDHDVIEDLQRAHAYEAIGKLLRRVDGALDHLVSEYARHDGYGHHFATWDGHEINLPNNFFAFQI